MIEKKMGKYEEMSEEQVLSLVGELREYILNAIRKVKQLREEAREYKREIEGSKKEQGTERIIGMYIGAIERLKRGNDEMEGMNSEGGVKTKIQQLKDIYESADSPDVKESVLVSLIAVNLELQGL